MIAPADIRRRICPGDERLWYAVYDATWILAGQAGVKLKQVKPMKRSMTNDWWGLYHGGNDRGIELTIRTWFRGTWNRRPELLYRLVNTIAHELAHASQGCGRAHGNYWQADYGRFLRIASEIDLRGKIRTRSGVKFPPE